MRLFAGLGNPGAKYSANRHNIGFMAVDRIAADHGFSPWRARFQGHTAEGTLGDNRVILLKPATFMNLSGQSVAEALRFYKLGAADLTVFHDELDLAPGKLRWKQGGGHAGHNGLRSLHGHIGDGYARVRLGIGHPGHKDAVAGYVLSDFAKAEAGWLADLVQGISDGAAALAAGDAARFANTVALHTGPPGPEAARSGAPKAARPEQAQPQSGQQNSPAAAAGQAGIGVPHSGARNAHPSAPERPGRAPTAQPPVRPPTSADDTGTGAVSGASLSPPSANAPTTGPAAPRTPLQRLADRFRSGGAR